jgi:hypothetical protein
MQHASIATFPLNGKLLIIADAQRFDPLLFFKSLNVSSVTKPVAKTSLHPGSSWHIDGC